MSEPAVQDQPQSKSSARPSVVKARLRKFASAVIGDLCVSKQAAALPMPALAAIPALCAHLVARVNLLELGSSMHVNEVKATLAVRGFTASDCDAVLLALQAVRLLVVDGNAVTLPLFDMGLDAHLAHLANRCAGWKNRGAAPEGKATELVPAAPAQSSLLEQAGGEVPVGGGSASTPAPKAAKRPRPGDNHRFGASDSIEPDGNDPTVARVQCECGGIAEITQSYIDHLQAAYRNIDALEQVRLAVVWCESNASRRKRLTGVRRFLNTWLGNAAREASVRAAVVRNGAQRNGFGQGGSCGRGAQTETHHGQLAAIDSALGDFDDLTTGADVEERGQHRTVAAPAEALVVPATPRVSAVVAARARVTLRGRQPSGSQRRLSDQLR